MFKIIKYRYIQSVLIQLIPQNCSYSQSSAVNLHNLLTNMPKDYKHIPMIQKNRLKVKEKSQNYIPGTFRIQILGSGAEGAPRALYVFSDHSRYMFNCGEGTQRLAHEHKMKLSRLEHIFITQPVWANMGGLPGLALTIQDVGVSDIQLHGPDGLDELFTATHRFVILKNLNVSMAECIENFEDNAMSIQYVRITKPANEELSNNETKEVTQNDEGNDASNVDSVHNKQKRDRTASVSRNSDSEDDNIDYYAPERSCSRPKFPNIPNERREQNTVINYICKLKSRPGELSLEKCVEKGVPPGPLLGKLKNGENITLSDGTIVYSNDVRSPDDPGPVFIVADCPNENYLDSFVTKPEWIHYQSTATKDDNLAVVVFHFSPPEITTHPRYQEWMEKFSPSTQHISLNSSGRCLGSASIYSAQNQLNLIDPEIFPKLKSQNVNDEIDSDSFTSKNTDSDLNSNSTVSNSTSILSESSNSSMIPSRSLWSYHLRPKKGLDRSNEIKNTTEEDVAEARNTEGFIDILDDLKTNLALLRLKKPKIENPYVLFLGTGSCIPNKTRNTSGILIKNSEDNYILLDCGEGTFGQLVRFFGKRDVIEILKNIKAIYVSHLHADHHIGLVGFLTGRRQLLNASNHNSYDPIYLFAPKQIMWWLNMYHQRFESISNEFVLISNASLTLDKHTCTDQYFNEVLQNIQLKSIDTTVVKHCPNAFGVAITTLSGHKITYSGDTMPCDALVQLGQDSFLLIHEATMEDELHHEARIKMHSTTSQALDIGKQMNAKYIILTHFSQRYARVPRIPDDMDNNVGIAFDNMKVTMSDLPVLPLLYPAFKVLFHDHCEQLENKAAKRQARIIRNREASLSRQKKRKLSTDNESVILEKDSNSEFKHEKLLEG
ncbi:ribonuclease Z, mitochondrial isoform X2 [Chrysoperla carnea]|uniref:ribonuclease Z, mitochondrial isoform X2 n=1 Tax=Chrysoperla carnea TaxID=189513 RepID=UPI001D05F152|nr:ribonuclease Z, mitochondrial isoform X2 [Chrysoperla carnea]